MEKEEIMNMKNSTVEDIINMVKNKPDYEKELNERYAKFDKLEGLLAKEQIGRYLVEREYTLEKALELAVVTMIMTEEEIEKSKS